MPVRDPLPGPGPSVKRRFWRIFRLMILLAIVVAAIAVILVARGDPTLHVHMMIATALGVGFTVLLGTSLMALTFLSSESGHDDQAGHGPQRENEDK